jgi:glycolate oxidase iron-sulfur subunit
MNNTDKINEIAAVCSSCGNCLFSCPVYNAELEEPLSPRGRVNLIKNLMDGRLEPGPGNQRFIYQCALCGGCEHICTKGVEFVDLMIDYRTKAAEGKNIPKLKKGILYLYQSFLFKKFTWVVDILARTPLGKKLTIPRRRKTKQKKLFSTGPTQQHYDILFFPGCVNTYFYPRIIEKSVKVLESHGFSVVVPKGLQCCGFPYLSQGWKEKFLSLSKINGEIFSRYNFKYLVVPCGTGTMTFNRYYNREGVGEQPFEIYEMTQFFYTHIPNAEIDIPAHQCGNCGDDKEREDREDRGEASKVTWHDPCHNVKSLGIAGAPRHFLKQMGEDFVDDTSTLCCGFGGIFSVGFPTTSKKILKRKEDKLKELGANTVVTACPGCYLHLRENLPKDKNVKFFIDIFDS